MCPSSHPYSSFKINTPCTASASETPSCISPPQHVPFTAPEPPTNPRPPRPPRPRGTSGGEHRRASPVNDALPRGPQGSSAPAPTWTRLGTAQWSATSICFEINSPPALTVPLLELSYCRSKTPTDNSRHSPRPAAAHQERGSCPMFALSASVDPRTPENAHRRM